MHNKTSTQNQNPNNNSNTSRNINNQPHSSSNENSKNNKKISNKNKRSNDTVISNFACQKKNLNIISWNCRSAKAHLTEITAFLNLKRPDILCLQETNLNDQEANFFLDFTGYDTYFKCRDNKDGGGVALIISKSLSYSDLDLAFEKQLSPYEICGCNVKLGETIVSIFSVYNPPKIDLSLDMLKMIDRNCKNFLIAGDLNAHIRGYAGSPISDNSGSILENFTYSTNASILNSSMEPTSIRLNDHCNNTLDYFVGSSLLLEKLETFTVDKKSPLLCRAGTYFHIPIVAEFKFIWEKRTSYKSHHVPFNYAKADWESFKENLEKIDSNSEDINLNIVDEVAKFISSNISNASEQSIPKININNDNVLKLPHHVLSLIKLKNYWMHRFYKNKTNYEAKSKFYQLKMLIDLEISNIRSEQFNRLVAKMGKNPTSTIPFWKKIGRMRNKKRSSAITKLIYNGREATSSEEKANVFAEKLIEVFSESTTNSFNNDHKNRILYELAQEKARKESKALEFRKFTLTELEVEIKRLNNKTSHDQQKISNRMLKHLPQSTKLWLLYLFNMCVTSNKLPTEWKRSKITMLLKKNGEKTDPNSYRPISITSCIMRLLERLILSRIREYLEQNNLIIHCQSGFRAKRQTRDNLFHLVQKAKENFHRGNETLSIFFDIEKAFDKMWHQGLLYKFHQINLPYYLIRFLENFLSDRKFCVQVDEFCTGDFIIKCGCPQGAVLSPTLFSWYINDIPIRSVKNSEYTVLFADDLAFYTFYKKMTVSIKNKIQDYLDELEKWANKWRLTFAPHKCNFTIFTKRGSSDNKKLDIKLYNQRISYEANPRFLGITFDENLKFELHADLVKSSSRSRLNIIKILSYSRWKLRQKTILAVYKSLTRSLIDYCAFLFSVMSKKAQETLQVVQNNALRVALKMSFNRNSKKNTKITTLHDSANIITVEERCKNLREKYILNSVADCNPLICDLINEYKAFAGGRILTTATLFDNIEVFDIVLPEKIGSHYQWITDLATNVHS
jgi:hypothetical protein